MIEALARIPVEVELASEFRYRDPIVEPGQLAIAISQSGETAGHALRAARGEGPGRADASRICNVVGSAMTREADLTVLTNAGPEIGVASTKAFTTQLAALYLLAVKLGRLRGTLDVGRAQELLTAAHRGAEAGGGGAALRGDGEADRARRTRTRRTSSSSAAARCTRWRSRAR